MAKPGPGPRPLFERTIRGTPPLPVFTLYFYEVGGRAECLKVELHTLESGRRNPLTASLIRKIPWGLMIERAIKKELQEQGRMAKTGEVAGLRMPGPLGKKLRREARRQMPPLEARAGKPGRPRQLGPDHFEQVAAIYTEAWSAGLPPTKTVAETMKASRSAAAKWVAAARDRGLLPKTKQRVAKARPAARKGKGK